MASKDGSSASGKLDASAPTFSPSVVQLTQRRSVADGQSQGATAPRGCTGGSTEMGQRQRQDSEVLGSFNHVGISSSTEDSDKNERSASGPRERRHDLSRFDGNSSSSHGRDADDAYGRRDAEQRRKGDRRPRRLGDSGGSVVDEASEADGHGHSHGGKGRKKSDRMVGANANHLLNFQFQPVSVAQSHGQHHHVTGGRRNNGSSKGRKGGRGWGEGASRRPMSRDQFLQANFQFLLHEPMIVTGDDSSASPVYQEAFFDPDVLVEWDTVDTVRLFRKVSRGPKALPRRGPPSIEMKIDSDSGKVEKTSGASSKDDCHWGSGLPSEQLKKSGMEKNVDVRAEATMTEDGENTSDGWRCPICLEVPIAPRITKCGHGPFCLVCILRHLRGEAYARCPLCFDNVHREQLRRAVFQEVATYAAGGRASLLLLQRERTSLVPRVIASGEMEGGIAVSGMNNDVPGVGSACPREGDDSERYSRIVVAKHSTLVRMSVLEQAALQHFRVTSIASGETEWVPFVSEAQASVAAQAKHLRSSPSPASTPAPIVLEGKDKEALHQQEGLGLGDGLEKPVIENSPKAPGSGGGGAFRFFQSLDGQRAFLHPLDMKQLMEDFEKGLPLPTRIDAQVLEVETVTLTPEMRRRLPFLGHLPVHCDIAFLELDMSNIVSPETSQKFQQETQKRERKRRAKTAAEVRAAAREAKKEEARRARIAAMRAFTIDLQGPKPGDVQPIQTTAEDTTTTAAVAAAVATDAPATTSSIKSSGQGLEGAMEGNLVAIERYDASNASPQSNGTEGVWSFARVTAMNGHFPSLPVTGTSPPKNTGTRVNETPMSRGAVETRRNSNINGRGSEVSNPSRGVWGTAKPEASGLLRTESVSCDNRDGTLVLEGGGSISGGKKKGRKVKKAVSIFSNAGVRGGGR